ncbi:MAG TPA: antibiotic biosynthesis monooxygenase [Xanthobacteraceae bacterium]|jgi:quinol monooxygenase YgiN
MRSIAISRAVPSLASIRRWAMAGVLAIGVAAAFGSSLPAQTAAPVYAVTYLDVSTDWVLQGTGLIKQFSDLSRKQDGNLEFSVMQETDRPNRFAIVEGWKDQAAFAAHGKSADTSLFNFTLEAIRNSPPDQHVLQAFAPGAARTASAGGAIHMVEHLDYQPAFGASAAPLVKTFAEASQKEAGVVRYDIYQEPPPHANHYSVVAVWANGSAYDAHEQAAHTKAFRAATVMPGHANLYDQRWYKLLD